MARVTYSLGSSFLKVFIFSLTVFFAYRVNEVAQPVLSQWITVPFACFAVLGAKCAVEAADAFFRRKLGYTSSRLDG